MRPLLAWLIFTLGLSFWFASTAARDLDNFRPVSNDEVELIEVGYNLATHGVFGSDMYAGFFGADEHHLWTLPVQHVLDASSFRLFGAGIAQARWVSVVAAVSIVWSVGWLMRRWFGLAAAVLTEILLTIWRSDLTAGATGLPLLDVARVARYDVLALAFTWLAILALDVTIVRPRRRSAFVAGACAGTAGLAQFFGIFVLPVLAVGYLWCGRNRFRDLLWLMAAAALVVAPWILYAALHASDLAGQLTVYGQRGDFLRPTFYLENIAAEPERYVHILVEPIPADVSGAGVLAYQASRWLLSVGAWPALGVLVWRSMRRDVGAPDDAARVGSRLLVLTFIVFGGLLLLVDQTKTPLYAILLVPSLCAVLASASVHVLKRAWRNGSASNRTPARWIFGLAATGLAVVLLVSVMAEGMRALAVDRAEAGQVSPYLEVGGQIDAALAPRSLVLGPERWWWALRGHPYISLRSIWFQWTAEAATGPERDLLEYMRRWRPDSIVVNNNARNDLQAFPRRLQDQFWSFIRGCTTLVAEVDDPTYFDTQVYRVSDCLR